MPRTKTMGRAANGNGSIRKKTVTRNGKEYTYWEARVTTGYDPGTGKQIQESITGKTQKDVAQKMREMALDVANGTYQPPSKKTVGEWLDEWLETYLGSVRPYTALNYTQHVNNHIKPALGKVRLDKLDTPTIQRFYNDLGTAHGDKPGLSPKTIKCVHGIFHKALQQAIALGYLRSNPTTACKLPKVEPKEIKPLDDEAIRAFMEAIQGHRFEVIYLVTLFTGLRRGEVCGLTWDCVDLERGTIFINKQLQQVPGHSGEFRLTPTKNGKGRTITAAAFVVDALKRHKVRQTEARLKAGPRWQEEGLVFTDEVGHRLSPNTVYHNYKRLVASIGLPEARLHDLRHSYAVASLRAGDDIKTVQSNLGHHTAAFTLDVYGHVTEEMKRASADRMEKFIQSVSGA
ncbi:tyrosine-type recombinase/integrase [Oscillibacter sp.]|uniref:tyrosine-type recombinase/integrase n=1 Tax=Oscillibacter sp. TaxID=1945593 RepID=UPI002D80535E|nr:site-specific integrase [Oscillibacter sp.]